MRRWARAAGRWIPVLLLVAASAAAQAPSPSPSTPDVPAGDGRVTGEIQPADDPGAVANADVILYSLSASGDPGLRRGRADAQGRFRFENIDASPGIVYLVGARIDGVPFGARFAFEPGQTEASVRITASAPTADASGLELGEAHAVIARGCRDLRVQQVHELRNETGRVVFVPPDSREGATPPLELTLPDGASEIETPLGNLEGF